jgi:hypothetical protein
LRALALPESGDELRALLGGPMARPEAEKARAIVRSSGAIESAVLTGRSWADRALAALSPMGTHGAVQALGQLGHSLLDQLPA